MISLSGNNLERQPLKTCGEPISRMRAGAVTLCRRIISVSRGISAVRAYSNGQRTRKRDSFISRAATVRANPPASQFRRLFTSHPFSCLPLSGFSPKHFGCARLHGVCTWMNTFDQIPYPEEQIRDESEDGPRIGQSISKPIVQPDGWHQPRPRCWQPGSGMV